MNDDQSYERRLLEAMQSTDPARGAYGLAEQLRDEGMAQLTMFRLYDNLREKLQDGDPRYDAVLDTMDCIVGRCPPAARLFEKGLSNEDIERFRRD